jgi:hypothetical protein
MARSNEVRVLMSVGPTSLRTTAKPVCQVAFTGRGGRSLRLLRLNSDAAVEIETEVRIRKAEAAKES